MMDYINPVVIVVVLGLVCGIILTVAAKFMAVAEDETALAVAEVLPGANCGACGFAGCADYAAAIAADRTLPTNACIPGGNAVSQAVSSILGMEFSSAASKVAVLKCSGTCDKTSYVMDYEGYPTCGASKLFFRGRSACEMACLGFGDCVNVCAYGALKIENGIAVVNRYKCVGCGACAKICPNKLFEILPDDRRFVVACSNRNVSEMTVQVCAIGCNACGACEETCKFDAVHVVGTHAQIDYDKCKNCSMCAKVCPRGVIKTFPKV